MSEIRFAVSEIDAHSQHVTTLGQEIDSIHSTVNGNVGDFLTYGVVCGAVLWPALKLVEGSHSATIAELAKTLHSTSEQLQVTATVYRDTEDHNADAALKAGS